MRKIHLMNEASRDATVAIDNVRALVKPALGLPGKTLSFRRYVAATEDRLDAAMVAAHGEGYAQALIDGDPEIDLEIEGRFLDDTAPVYLGLGRGAARLASNGGRRLRPRRRGA